MQEMEYSNEASNGIKFRRLDGSIPDVVVPLMYTEYTTHKVLVMEWIEGKKLSEVKDLYLIEEFTAHSINFLSVGSIMQIHIYEHKVDNLAFNFPQNIKQVSVLDLVTACPASPNPTFLWGPVDAYSSSWIAFYKAVRETLDQEGSLLPQDGLATCS
ncbi:hypothetical protein RIF29_05685 [Crotalaria pallida]|uniref:ABC1 atypical kinase-like domain-containing protein n=1 Tax=Crotalaria pallida TaxID=3830 RepID=A0AAN9J327_CROPI